MKTVAISRGVGVNPWFGVFCLAVAAACCYAIANVRRSATGRMFLATRSNERAAAAAGVATLWMAVLADTGASVIVLANALRLRRFS